jgi:hypothetical protein
VSRTRVVTSSRHPPPLQNMVAVIRMESERTAKVFKGLQLRLRPAQMSSAEQRRFIRLSYGLIGAELLLVVADDVVAGCRCRCRASLLTPADTVYSSRFGLTRVWHVCVARVCGTCVWRVCVARVCGSCRQAVSRAGSSPTEAFRGDSLPVLVVHVGPPFRCLAATAWLQTMREYLHMLLQQRLVNEAHMDGYVTMFEQAMYSSKEFSAQVWRVARARSICCYSDRSRAWPLVQEMSVFDGHLKHLWASSSSSSS